MSTPSEVLFVSRLLAGPQQHGGCVYPHAVLQALRAAGSALDYGWLAHPLHDRRRPVMRDPLRGAGFRRTAIPGTAACGSLRFAWPPREWPRLRRAPAPVAGERFPDAAEQAWFAALVARWRPRRVLVDFAVNLPLLDTLPAALRRDLRVAVLTHNLVSRRTGLYRQHRQPLDFLPLSAAEEAALLARADVVVAIQGREAAAFRDLLPDRAVVTVPMPLDPAPLPAATGEPTALFIGGHSGHNLAGLDWLLREVWPAVRAALPSARLLVAGTVGKAVPPGAPGVQALGAQPDLRPVYAAAHVVLAPLPLGTGLKIKVVEGMAAGRAVVTTPAGAEGFPELENGATVAVAESAAAFAAATVRLLRAPAERDALVARQLAWVAARLQPATALAPLLAAW